MKSGLETTVLVADLAGTVATALTGGLVCFAVRMLAVTCNWQLPGLING
jgi:uncharacterized membrane protein YeiH